MRSCYTMGPWRPSGGSILAGKVGHSRGGNDTRPLRRQKRTRKEFFCHQQRPNFVSAVLITLYDIYTHGFRTDDSREDFLRIYQAVKYLGWRVHGELRPQDAKPP